MTIYKTFADAMSATPKPIAANDNKPRKKPEPKYRGTLPALRWLYDNHPELAPAMADAVQALAVSNWDADSVDSQLEMRPTIGELMRAATDSDTGEYIPSRISSDSDGNTCIRLGSLVFKNGELVEYGRTRKGRKLEPREKSTSRGEEPSMQRNPTGYVKLRGAIVTGMDSESYQRPFSGEPALPPMYDPQRDVEANRAVLVALGVDGSVAFDDLPFPATRYKTVIAKGAEFLGGIASTSGTASSGALMWEAPSPRKSEVNKVIEAVAARATLKEIGERLGYEGARVDRMAKAVLVDAAKTLIAANDNSRKKNVA